MQNRAFKRLGLALPVALLAFSLAACGGGSRTHRGRPGAQAPAAIPTATAGPATVHPTAQIAGIVAPYQNVSISSSLSEPTDAVNVLQGDHVTKGEVLAVLDTADLRATYEADERNAASSDAKAQETKYQATLNLGQGSNQVDSAKAALQQAQASLKQAQADYNRYNTLLSGGYISQQQVQQQQTLMRTDQQQVSSEQASLQTAELNEKVNGSSQQGLQAATVQAAVADAQSAHAQADQVEAQIARATIVSPVDGVVVNRNLNPGEYPGSRTIFTVQQLDPVYAELNASSSNVFAITRGSPVTLAVAGINGVSYQGRVNAVLGQVSPGSTNFTVETIVPNPGMKLQSGMAVTGTIDLPAVSGVGIPAAAFLDDSHTSIMIVDANDDAKQVSVKELGTDGKTSVVSGIAQGTKIVANGQLGLTDGESLANPASPSPGASGSPGPNGYRHRRGTGSASPESSASPGQ
jgi:multidrug resistance efflux pump